MTADSTNQPQQPPEPPQKLTSGGQPGNQNAALAATPEEVRRLYKAITRQLVEGVPIGKIPGVSRNTIKRYAREFPDEFPQDGINKAREEGALIIFRKYLGGAMNVVVRERVTVDKETGERVKVVERGPDLKRLEFILRNMGFDMQLWQMDWDDAPDIEMDDSELEENPGQVVYEVNIIQPGAKAPELGGDGDEEES